MTTHTGYVIRFSAFVEIDRKDLDSHGVAIAAIKKAEKDHDFTDLAKLMAIDLFEVTPATRRVKAVTPDNDARDQEHG